MQIIEQTSDLWKRKNNVQLRDVRNIGAFFSSCFSHSLGDAIIDALVSNSQTFQQRYRTTFSNSISLFRTEMSKQKYLKKKMEKYLVILEVIRPTALSLIKTYFSKSPQKIWYPLVTPNSSLLHFGNFVVKCEWIVWEFC
jgi:replication initiation and membrane attachment protein DnaB